MNILHVITGLSKAAGTSTFCGEVCNQLVALGHNVTIAVSNPAANNIYPLDSRVHLVTIESILSSPQTTYFSLVHLHAIWTPILHRVSNWAHTCSIPVVWSTHGMTAPWALHHKWWKKLAPWYLYQRTDLKSAQLIHCTTDMEVDWNNKIGLKQTFIAPLGCPFPTENNISIQRQPINLQVHTLLYVGRIYPVKALDSLIRAFAMAIKAQSDQQIRSCSIWRLRIVGPDQSGYKAELLALCEELGIVYLNEQFGNARADCCNDNGFGQTNSKGSSPYANSSYVQFVGPCYGALLEKEYEKCDALALVSHTENFGATVVEAMVHGKPVITSTKTPWKIVADADCGWWVDNDPITLADAIRQLIECPESRLCAMGANARNLVKQRYSWTAICQSIILEYEKIVRCKEALR